MENINAIIEAEATKAQRSGKRKAKEISQCDDEIKAQQERLNTSREKRRRLQAEKQQYSLVETLKAKGTRAWNALDNERKWQKANVLAVLCSDKTDEKLPVQLHERQWITDSVPESLRQDRDVLLARLAHKDFSDAYSAWAPQAFRLPPQFHGDKTVALATMKQYPKILQQDVLVEELLDDHDVSLAFVHSKKLKQRDFHLLSKFSQRIRGNASFMLQAAKQLDAIVVLDNFTGSLAGNYSFAQKLVKVLHEEAQSSTPDERVFGRFSNSIRSRKDIVLALVQKNGRCLQDASPSLRRDSEVVRAACENNASALAFAEGSMQRQLGRNTEFLMEIFSRWPEGASGDPQLYRHLPERQKLDRSIVVAANKNGNLSFTDLPAELEGDPDFWLEVIKRDSSIWRSLPEDYENDPSFAKSIDYFCDGKLVAEVFGRFPFLAEERDIWLAISSSRSRVDIEGAILQHATEQICCDNEVMALACEKDPKVMGMLSNALQTDRTIVEAAVRGSGYFALPSIPPSTQILYPDLVIQALDSCKHNDESRYELMEEEEGTVLAESLWGNCDIVRAWFKNGGQVPSRVPDSLKNDPDFGLAFASGIDSWISNNHSNDFEDNDWLIGQFRSATSAELRQNKEFMMQAVALNGIFFFAAVGDLRRNVDLAIVAYSGDQDLVGFQFDYREYDDDYNGDVRFLERVLETAQSKVTDYECFSQGFLPGMSAYAGNDCRLSMLVTGTETTLAFKKMIAAFVGVPTGQSVKQNRKTVANLSSSIPDPIVFSDCNCENCRMRY